MAHLAATSLAPHSKFPPRVADHLLFPEEEMGLHTDIEDRWDSMLDRAAARSMRKGD